MTRIHIPTYGFAGLAMLIGDEPHTLVSTDPNEPFIWFRPGVSKLSQTGRAMKQRLCNQLAERNILEHDRRFPGEGFNVTVLGTALLIAINERPDGWSQHMIELDKFLKHVPRAVIAKLCGMPFLDADRDQWYWTPLFE